VAVLAVSRDSPFSHRSYSESLYLTIPLLSDWTGDATRGFGVAQTLAGLPEVPMRTCFLIGGDGVVHGAWRYADDELPDVDVLLTAARAAQGAG
jgi:peroxiredoxin